MAGKNATVIAGQGQAPRLATREFFERREARRPALIPSSGPLAATTPGMFDACLVALARYGRLRLEEVMRPAVELAEGHPIDELRVRYIHNTRRVFEPWEAARRIFLPAGREPEVGELFVQADLARTLTELIEVERRNRSRGRAAAIEAVRDHFYRGPVGARIGAAMEAMGGLMRADDLRRFRAEEDAPARGEYQGYEILKPGFWTQGPVLIQTLNLLEGYDLRAMGHNSADYIHTVTEALKLALADRDRYYADPRFARVPAAELLSKDYAARRRALIEPARASLEQRPGDPANGRALGALVGANLTGESEVREDERAHDTTCVNVIDAGGNVFSATPSGAWLPAVVAGETGIMISHRLQSFLLVPGHPNMLEPGKRPRITLTPTIVMRGGQPFAALSTPGGDNQDQALLQVLLNVIVFGMNPQEAVEAARFETLHLVSSFDDHRFQPGLLQMEERIGAAVIDELRRRGHRVEVRPDYHPGSAPTIVMYDPAKRTISAGADVRRGRYAVAW
jgi:gamma-glutamyltranspeptidase/glutathione hydrolase